MKICLVSAFPPSHEQVNEYGYHLAHELQRNPFLSLTILADAFDANQDELPDFEVVRCWRPNSIASPWTLLKAIRECNPEVVWFNLVFSTFGGRNPLAAFLGLCTPMLARLMGYSTHVTLHHLTESLDLPGDVNKRPVVYRAAEWIATKVLLLANSVTVLLPDYRTTLLKKYRARNVHLRAHGIFGSNPEPPDFRMRGNPVQRILAFGKWGAHKRLEVLLDAFARVAAQTPHAHLVVAGEDHPSAPGYIDTIRAQCGGRSDISFTGYVPEREIPTLFKQASVLVMPYTFASGPSRVAHLAAQFGVPIVCTNLPELRDMAAENELAIEFVEKENAGAMAAALITLLHDEAKQVEMAEQNFSGAVRMTMPLVMSEYIRSFGWPTETHSHLTASPLAALLARGARAQPTCSTASGLVGTSKLPSLPAECDAALQALSAAGAHRHHASALTWWFRSPGKRPLGRL